MTTAIDISGLNFQELTDLRVQEMEVVPRESAAFTVATMSEWSCRVRCTAYDGGGMNRHIRRMSPFPGRMQACILPSFDSRCGKSAGTNAVPCFVVTARMGSLLSGSGARS